MVHPEDVWFSFECDVLQSNRYSLLVFVCFFRGGGGGGGGGGLLQ